MKPLYGIFFACLVFFIAGCGSSAPATSNYKMNFTTKFSSSQSITRERLNPLSSCGGQVVDFPGLTAGTTCTGSAHIAVRYQTPTAYKIAFKSIYLTDGTNKVYYINHSHLSDVDSGSILPFTSAAATAQITAPAGFALTSVPTAVGWEIYYFELTLTLYGQSQVIRIYMSDDDFTSEGAKGHHPGDITFIDATGTERWAKGGFNWVSDLSSTTLSRGTFANGAGGIDAQTGHAHGMFGDSTFWNTQAKIKESATYDYYYDEISFGSTKASLATSVGATFDISNTWFYDKYDDTSGNNASFDPCLNSSQEGCGGVWAPLYPTITSTAN